MKQTHGNGFRLPASRFSAIHVLSLVLVMVCYGQQTPDLEYHPPIERPAYRVGAGPVVGIDEAHHNFHTASGRYAPFAKLLRRDGYQVNGFDQTFSEDALAEFDIIVIANALHQKNDRNWKLPTPSAFSNREIAALHNWVLSGGSLFLIADHMPFPGGAGKLAETFGFEFSNGFAYFPRNGPARGDTFELGSGLRDSPVTRGRIQDERVAKMVTFTGSAFKAPKDAIPVLVFPPGSVSRNPSIAWKFESNTPEIDISGWNQGALLIVGQGRIAVFGEAASFTSQLAGPQKRRIGMGAAHAEQNYQLLLNIMHWLSDLEGMPDG